MTEQFNYDTLIVHIAPAQRGCYRVEITTRCGLQVFGGAILRRDSSILPWVPTDSAKQDSRRLTDWFLRDNGTKRAWESACAQSPRRRIFLKIDGAASELHALPWELLGGIDANRPDESLSANESTPFSRLFANEQMPGRAIDDSPIRVLVAIASPTDLPQWSLSPICRTTHLRIIADALGELSPDQYWLEPLEPPVSLERIEQKLTKRRYHILHLVAHGKAFPHKPARLYLADDRNLVDENADEDRLAEMIGRTHKPGLIFLGSCESARRDTGDAYRGLAPKLVDVGVPSVLAMQDSILDASLQDFARAFYTTLFSCGQVDRAANLARARLITKEMSGRAVPVLFCRLSEGRLLDPSIIREVKPRLECEPETVYVPAENRSDAFRIGRNPVTNRQYAAFVRDSTGTANSPRSSLWDSGMPAKGREAEVLTGIGFHDAVEYCAWLTDKTGRTYRLPTKEEWEQALGHGLIGDSKILELTSTSELLGGTTEMVVCCQAKGDHSGRLKSDKFKDELGFRVARDP